jgi:hypothetical protein
MKFIAVSILFVFVTFLSTPAIVTLIEKNTDISLFYSFSEEEVHKSYKEIKAAVKESSEYHLLDTKINPNTIIVSENLSRHDNVADEIFSPPPELM